MAPQAGGTPRWGIWRAAPSWAAQGAWCCPPHRGCWFPPCRVVGATSRPWLASPVGDRQLLCWPGARGRRRVASILVPDTGPSPNAPPGHVSARRRLKTNQVWGHVAAPGRLIRRRGWWGPGRCWHLPHVPCHLAQGSSPEPLAVPAQGWDDGDSATAPRRVLGRGLGWPGRVPAALSMPVAGTYSSPHPVALCGLLLAPTCARPLPQHSVGCFWGQHKPHAVLRQSCAVPKPGQPFAWLTMVTQNPQLPP